MAITHRLSTASLKSAGIRIFAYFSLFLFATFSAPPIEIVHRRSLAGDAEQISINLQAVLSFEAFGRFLETANPFAFWAQAAQMAWLPWLGAARSLMLPWSVAPSPPRLGPGSTEPRLNAE
jgi:hypothetical protein